MIFWGNRLLCSNMAFDKKDSESAKLLMEKYFNFRLMLKQAVKSAKCKENNLFSININIM